MKTYDIWIRKKVIFSPNNYGIIIPGVGGLRISNQGNPNWFADKPLFNENWSLSHEKVIGCSREKLFNILAFFIMSCNNYQNSNTPHKTVYNWVWPDQIPEDHVLSGCIAFQIFRNNPDLFNHLFNTLR